MSFLNKMMAKVGIGAAKVDTLLDHPTLSIGELVKGKVQVVGGKTEQRINKIDVLLMCNYFDEEERTQTNDDGETETESVTVERDSCLFELTLPLDLDLNPEEQHLIDFEFELPPHTPLTLGASQVWISTNLDIDFALDRQDKDVLQVVANEQQSRVVEALMALGFELHEAKTERSVHLPHPIQELEFKPRQGDFVEQLDELDLVFLPHPNGFMVMLEIDRRARGLRGLWQELTGTDESKVNLVIEDQSVDELQRQFADLIRAFSH